MSRTGGNYVLKPDTVSPTEVFAGQRPFRMMLDILGTASPGVRVLMRVLIDSVLMTRSARCRLVGPCGQTVAD